MLILLRHYRIVSNKSLHKQRLIILSDLWGKNSSSWIPHYTSILASHFDIHYYDCCELAGVDTTIYTQDNLHQQFLNGGIAKAVSQLVALETTPVHILAFSIGGTIAWQFGLKSSLIQSLYCVSSTRLRHELHKPKGTITLYYGDNDSYKPTADWIKTLQVDTHIIKDKDHLMYAEKAIATLLSETIVSTH